MADCSRGGYQPSDMHDHQQRQTVYVGSPDARKMTTRDSDEMEMVVLPRGSVLQNYSTTGHFNRW